MEREEFEDDDEPEEEEIEDPEQEPPEEVYTAVGQTNFGQKERTGADRIADPYLDRYAKSALISLRAKQLQSGKPSTIPPSRWRSGDILEIAKQELKERVIPLMVVRKYADGWFEIWRITDFQYVADE